MGRFRCATWLRTVLAALAISAVLSASRGAEPEEGLLIGQESGGFRARVVPIGIKWGIELEGAGAASVREPEPVCVQVWRGGDSRELSAGYEKAAALDGAVHCTAILESWKDGPRLEIHDAWTFSGERLAVSRRVLVHGNAGEAGFLSTIRLRLKAPVPREEVRWFIPGHQYGAAENLSEMALAAGKSYGSAEGAHYELRIREDRLPAPLVAARFSDGASLAVMDARPDGRTTREDGRDAEVVPLVDERLRFGSLMASEGADGLLALGFCFPGTEGPVTYRGDTYPGGQVAKWRRRYHPLRNGLSQNYTAAFRVGRDADFLLFQKASWRWAWKELEPESKPVNLGAARQAMVDVLSACVEEADGRAGIANFRDAVTGKSIDRKAVLGFTGKNLEAAEFLLVEAERRGGEAGKRLRSQAEAIIASFLKLGVSPPEGEGFRIADGASVCALERSGQVFLRSFGDDLKALLRAYRREREAGRDHAEWLQWGRRFGDWLLTGERSDGGFPRSWQPGTGRVVSDSPSASYCAIPLLVMLTELTGEPRYGEAAARAGEMLWKRGQSEGRFVGGTIDNPDVLDKEAGTLSLEAYLALYRGTKKQAWLERAKAAADFAESWIYLWNVPMPEDEASAELHWKPGVSTVGLQLIATGHSLVDAYMAFDVDEFAELYLLTGDEHYREVARLLLHNTKGMLAIPGRTFDLAGPGWQQEHWSLAPKRGFGLHRGWLPWVATSQLNGICGLEELDLRLYQQLASEGDSQ